MRCHGYIYITYIGTGTAVVPAYCHATTLLCSDRVADNLIKGGCLTDISEAVYIAAAR